MKIAISLPDDLFARAEEAAARAGLNRSQFVARALEQSLSREGADPVTARLDELATELGEAPSAAYVRRLVDSGAWEW